MIPLATSAATVLNTREKRGMVRPCWPWFGVSEEQRGGAWVRSRAWCVCVSEREREEEEAESKIYGEQRYVRAVTSNAKGASGCSSLSTSLHSLAAIRQSGSR